MEGMSIKHDETKGPFEHVEGSKVSSLGRNKWLATLQPKLVPKVGRYELLLSCDLDCAGSLTWCVVIPLGGTGTYPTKSIKKQRDNLPQNILQYTHISKRDSSQIVPSTPPHGWSMMSQYQTLAEGVDPIRGELGLCQAEVQACPHQRCQQRFWSHHLEVQRSG